jgi:hypothetical protein
MLATQEQVLGVAGDLKVLGKFVEVFCRRRHRGATRSPFRMPAVDLSPTRLGRREVCAECARLLRHAVTKRLRCPLSPKPSCRVCPVHCYAPEMRARIREVMKFSGRHLILRGHLHLLFHFLVRRPKAAPSGCGDK